jgi:hypothetical protein
MYNCIIAVAIYAVRGIIDDTIVCVAEEGDVVASTAKRVGAHTVCDDIEASSAKGISSLPSPPLWRYRPRHKVNGVIVATHINRGPKHLRRGLYPQPEKPLTVALSVALRASPFSAAVATNDLLEQGYRINVIRPTGLGSTGSTRFHRHRYL